MMKRVIVPLLLSGLAVTSQTAFADTEKLQALLQKNNCVACHMIDKRKYGPKLVEVAAKYANDSGAVGKLAKKNKAGGTGVWGEDIMPPQAHVSDADAKTMAEYILALK